MTGCLVMALVLCGGFAPPCSDCSDGNYGHCVPDVLPCDQQDDVCCDNVERGCSFCCTTENADQVICCSQSCSEQREWRACVMDAASDYIRCLEQCTARSDDCREGFLRGEGADLVDVKLAAGCAADEVIVDVYATSETEGVEVAGLQLLLHWDSESLALIGYEEGEYTWLEDNPFLPVDINDDWDDGEAFAAFFAVWFDAPFTPIFVGSLVFQVLSGEDLCVAIDGVHDSHPDIRTRVSSPGVFGEVTGVLTNDCADDCPSLVPEMTLAPHEMLVALPGGRHAASCLDCYTILDPNYDSCHQPSPCRWWEPGCCDMFAEECDECCAKTNAHQVFCCTVMCWDRPDVPDDSQRACLSDAMRDDWACEAACDNEHDDCEPEA